MNSPDRRRLQVVEGAPAATPELVCRRPSCGVPLRPPPTRGRPIEFCSPECGRLAAAELRSAEAELRRAQALVDQYRRAARRGTGRVDETSEAQSARIAAHLEVAAHAIQARVDASRGKQRSFEADLDELLSVVHLAIAALKR